MARCDACSQEMTDNVSCTQEVYDDFPDGVMRERIRYPHLEIPGQYGVLSRSTIVALQYATDWPTICHDCKTPQGGLHHPGCDVERCPRCSGQLISCDCYDEVYDGVEFDDA